MRPISAILAAFISIASIILLADNSFAQSPHISSISPTSLAPGMQATLTGTGFGAAQGSGFVGLQNMNSVPIVSWSDTRIVVTVPTGTIPGNATVKQNGVYSNPVAFTMIPPTLTSISPTSLAPGIQATLTGSGFGAVQGSGFVGLQNMNSVPIVSWSDTQIVVTVPAGTIPGNATVKQNGVYSNPKAFTMIPPTLTSISPTSLAPGMQATLTGSGFGAVQGSGTVSLQNQNNAPVVSWSDTQIVITVPAGTTSGHAYVTQNGVASGYANYTIVPPPNITGISPSSAPSAAVVTIVGTNLGTAGTVTFNGTTATPTSWTTTSIVVPVPANATSGNVVVTISGLASNGVNFTVLPTPAITSLSPSSGPVGSQVTITGTNFGSTQGSSTISFNGTLATTIGNWNSNQIAATVPVGAATGNIVVTVNSVPSNGLNFTVLPTPNIASLSPTSGSVGTSVSITGTNFGSTQGSSTVSFNGTPATTIGNWNPTQITATVPAGATTGNVVVTVNGVPSNGLNFTVIAGTSLNVSRYLHSATLLDNGKILIAGGVSCPTAGSCAYLSSAEIYDPSAKLSTSTGSLAKARSAPAVLLTSGKVLIAGGFTCDSQATCSSLKSAEIYDPASGAFAGASNMALARDGHTMTLLADGKVLIAGGETCTTATSCTALSSAEIYDPVAGTFTAAANGMSAARFGASAVALSSGRVLIAGGFDGANLPAAAEIYDPGQPGFTWNGARLSAPRFGATTTLLNSGKVLVAGGSTCYLFGCPTNAAEIYDPVANVFSTVTGGMTVPGFVHTATLLTNGQVLFAGGFSSCTSLCTGEASTELFDPTINVFSGSQGVGVALAGHTGTLTPSGNVLFTGGINAGVTLATTEWYQPTSMTPPNLVSISVTPSSLFLMPGQTQQLAATGTFSDGTTQTLQSALWSSSNPPAAVVSNAPGNQGIVSAQATGAATITASAGSIAGSSSLHVAGLVSLNVTPGSPSISIGGGQQLIATASFSDGSTQDVTTSATWSSSNSSIALVGNTQGFQGFAMGVSAGTANITATLGGTSAHTPVTVQNSSGTVVPSITSVSPSTVAPNTQVTVYGSGFGSQQGSGTVWLGSTYASVLSWSDQQIVATVSPIAQSGTAAVQQNGLWSNAVPLNVNTATISGISPTSGVPGTQVTITGSGFGSSQGNGQVWLGTVNGVVQNWSDTQIVAEVATGSKSGSALVLQNGVMSNPVPFAVNGLQIVTVNPSTGGPGTTVTITGTGFGATQGSGIVWLGSTAGNVMSWTDTQVVATVASSALSGVARIEQNGVWSNAVTFTVPSGNSLTLNPNQLNLVVGETHNIQAPDANGQSVTGLTWVSSDQAIVQLSTDDPPILTALAVGHVTITAGSASADVVVWYPGTLPPGTVLWSNPGDGSGVASIVPAVPSASGLADVFAFNTDNTVSAIQSDGTTAWTATLPSGAQSVPDFQGGLVVASPSQPGAPITSIVKWDGITGKPNPAFTAQTADDTLSKPVVHTDGTIFTIDTNSSTNTASAIAISPTTGGQRFSAAATQSTTTFTNIYKYQFIGGNGGCGGGGGTRPSRSQHLTPMDSQQGDPYGDWTITSKSLPNVIQSIIAGDGYHYTAYEYQEMTSTFQDLDQETLCVVYHSGSWTIDTVTHLMLLRVGTDGSSSNTHVRDFDQKTIQSWDSSSNFDVTVTTGTELGSVQMITNADQGITLGWKEETACPAPGSLNNWATSMTSQYTCNQVTKYGFATTVGTSVSASIVPAAAYPVLQAQDGTFYGTDDNGNMVRMTGSGYTMWSVPNDSPQIATADGGVIGSSGTTYDSQGRITGLLESPPALEWTGNPNTYSVGSARTLIASLVLPINAAYGLFQVSATGNPSNTNAVQQCPPLPSTVNQVLVQAYSDLTNLLSNATKCPQCDTQILTPLKVKRSDFVKYLQQAPRLCDGTQATAISASKLTTESQYQKMTVAQFFKADKPNAATVRNGPNSPLWVFFDPATISPGDGTLNDARLFHEGLHGYTKLFDSYTPLAGNGLCELLPGLERQYPDCPANTIRITYWIEDLVWPVP